MHLVQVARDDTMMVSGYEHHTLQCSGCGEVERRLVFSSGGSSPAAERASPPTAPTASAAPPAEPASPPTEPESPPTAPPASGARPATAPPQSVASEADDDLDEGEALLRRAIEMVRGPTRRSQPINSVADRKPGTPAELANSMRAKRPLTDRIVQIYHDPHEAAYIAKDTKSGLSVLRHQDGARLRAMCDRIGWQVVDGAAPRADD